MTAVARWKSGHFHIVAEQMMGRGQGIDFALEIAFLVIPARPPAETAADVEIFAENVAHHVLWGNALGRTFVVGAAGGMDVVVAGVPAFGSWMNPALEAELFGMDAAQRHRDRLLENTIFRTSCIADGVLARLQGDRFAVGPVNLIVKIEVRSQPATGRGIDAAQTI